MKRFNRLYMATAIAAAMAGGMAAAPQASAAFAVDAQVFGDVVRSQFGTVMAFPYYTVRNDDAGNPFHTTFIITNTSRTNSAVLKFRLRDHVNSEDVIDFILILSPTDEVVATLDREGDEVTGQPRVTFPIDENSCRVPNRGNAGSHTYIAPGPAAGGPETDYALEGHVEVVGMMMLQGVASTAATHVTQNCELLEDIFSEDGPVQAGLLGMDALPMQNVLRGSYEITNKASGFSAGGEPILVKDWGVNLGNNGLGAGTGSPFYFGQNPNATAMTTRLDGSDTQQHDHPHLGDSINSANIDDGALGTESVINNWSVNPVNGVGIDWVITYITKYLWRDTNNDFGGPGWPVAVAPTAPGGYTPKTPSPWTVNVDGGTSGVVRCITYPEWDYIYDREEDKAGGAISPGDPGTVRICNEANVLSFTRNNNHRIVLDPLHGLEVDTSDVDLPYGWAELLVRNTGRRVAVAGFSYTLRNLFNAPPATSYAALKDHTRSQGQRANGEGEGEGNL